MSQIVRYKLRFNRFNKKLKKDEKSRISIEVYFSRNCRRFLPTDILIKKDEWDEKNKIINSKNSNYRYLNNHLSDKIAGLKNYELELSVKGQTFSPDFLKLYLEGKTDSGQYTFNDFYKQKLEDERGIATGTLLGYRNALSKLNSYNKNIRFSDINYSFIKDFENFLIGQALSPNSRANIHNGLKKYMHIAISCELLSVKNMPYRTLSGGAAGKFSIPNEQGSKTPLNFDELERIEKLEYPLSEIYEKWKDAFLFTCYTGLRNCDEVALNFSHLVHSSSGYSIDLPKMIKTKRPVYLELFTLFDGKPEKILRKYLIKKYGTDDYESILKTGDRSPIFPSIHSEHFNKALKVIGRDAKIQKHLTTHCGRHTFGTQMAILTNGNQYLVMDLLGHADPSTTLIYVKLGERMVNQQLRNVDWQAHAPKVIPQEITEVSSDLEKTTDQDKDHSPITEAKEVMSFLYNEVISNAKIGVDEKIPFALDENSIASYISSLPFSSDDIEKYQKNPFEISGYLIGMKYSKLVSQIESTINNLEWLKENCLKISIKLLPIPLKKLDVIEIGAI